MIPPAGTMARYRVQEWLHYIATELHKGFAPLYGKVTPEEVKAAAREKLESAVRVSRRGGRDAAVLDGADVHGRGRVRVLHAAQLEARRAAGAAVAGAAARTSRASWRVRRWPPRSTPSEIPEPRRTVAAPAQYRAVGRLEPEARRRGARGARWASAGVDDIRRARPCTLFLTPSNETYSRAAAGADVRPPSAPVAVGGREVAILQVAVARPPRGVRSPSTSRHRWHCRAPWCGLAQAGTDGDRRHRRRTVGGTSVMQPL